MSLIVLIGLSEFSLILVASLGLGDLDHGQGLSGVGAHNLILVPLVGGHNLPLGSFLVLVVLLAALLLVLWVLYVHFGNQSSVLLWASGQYFGLSLLNDVKSHAVVGAGWLVTLLCNQSLFPWGTTLLVCSNHLGGSLPVLVAGTATAILKYLLVLLVNYDNLALTAKEGGSTVGQLSGNASLLVCIEVLVGWALFLGPFAIGCLAMEVRATLARGGTFLVLTLSVTWLVLAGELVDWARLALAIASGLLLTGFIRLTG